MLHRATAASTNALQLLQDIIDTYEEGRITGGGEGAQRSEAVGVGGGQTTSGKFDTGNRFWRMKQTSAVVEIEKAWKSETDEWKKAEEQRGSFSKRGHDP